MPNRNTGTCPRKFTIPSSSVECVSRHTSQDCATLCIHVPASETPCPAKNRRRSRLRSERRASGQRMVGTGGVLRVAGSGSVRARPGSRL